MFLFLVAFISFYISRYHFSQFFRTSFNINWKKDFLQKFSFFNGFTQAPPTPDGQNPLCVTNVFCRCSFNQKGDFQTKTKKANMHILYAFNAFNEFCIFKLALVPNFTLNSFEFWDQTFPKRVFLVHNRKSSHRNLILHIRLRRGSKFQSKLTILIF